MRPFPQRSVRKRESCQNSRGEGQRRWKEGEWEEEGEERVRRKVGPQSYMGEKVK
jgi:hypothetical protein